LAALHFTLLRGVSCSRNRVTGGRAGAWHGMAWSQNGHASGSVQMAVIVAITFVLGWPISAGRMGRFSQKQLSCRSNLSSHPMSICRCREVSCHCLSPQTSLDAFAKNAISSAFKMYLSYNMGHGVGVPWGAEARKPRGEDWHWYIESSPSGSAASTQACHSRLVLH
jgi:hypothetical protein